MQKYIAQSAQDNIQQYQARISESIDAFTSLIREAKTIQDSQQQIETCVQDSINYFRSEQFQYQSQQRVRMEKAENPYANALANLEKEVTAKDTELGQLETDLKLIRVISTELVGTESQSNNYRNQSRDFAFRL